MPKVYQFGLKMASMVYIYHVITQIITNKMHFEEKKVLRAESSAESFPFRPTLSGVYLFRQVHQASA